MDLTEIQQAIKRGLATLEAPPPLRLSQWAERYFYLSAESSYVEKLWTAFPFQVGIMDCMSNDDIAEVTLKKSARVGYTKMILAAMGYFAQHKRRNQALWQPTDDDADDFVKTELDPMLRDVKIMQSVFPEYLARHRNNTLRQKTYLGSTQHIRGGKAAKNYRRLSVDVAILDELDGFDNNVEKEGSPVTLSRKRVEGATFPKHILGSTPKLKGFSLIEAREEQAERSFRFVVPCPDCGVEHALRWGGKDKHGNDLPYGFKWSGDDLETVTHQCGDCGTNYTQADFLAIASQGRWIDATGAWIDPSGQFKDCDNQPIPAPHSVAFHVWTAYSPMTTWVQIVREFLSANAKAKAGDTSELQTFINTTLGETWEVATEQTDQGELIARAEPYALRTIPLGGLVLTAGVDVQDNRFEIVVWAWGRGEETWVIDYMVLTANPSDERDWDRLDEYLTTKFKHTSGQTLGIEAVAIDTGGHYTHQTYHFCRSRKARKMYAVKGENQHGLPVKGRASIKDVNWQGKVIKNGVKLWFVGTDTAKDLVHGRLQVATPGPGYVHFSKDLPEVFYSQLTAEARVLQQTTHGTQYRWMLPNGRRNEVLDCTVYAIFAAHALDLHRYTERMWARLEAAVQPAVLDLFNQPLTIEEAAAPQTVQLPSQPTPPQQNKPALRANNPFAKEDWSTRGFR